MGLWNWLVGGGIGAVAKGVETVGGVFRPNAEAADRRAHDFTVATHGQFAAEFRNISNRSRWDSFVDGLNRLPRPLITLGVLGLFVMAPLDPNRFLDVAAALNLIPAGMWALLSVIIAFYFGGRMQMTSRDFHISKAQVDASKQIAAMHVSEDEPETIDGNAVVQRWLRKEGK